MAATTGIAWAHSTANPWTGCRRVSPGCQHCYMFTWKERHGKKGTDRERTKSMWKDAIRWNKDAATVSLYPRRPRIFPSLCDWLDDEVPIEWLADFLKLIHDTPNLEWLLLTKRPENFFDRVSEVYERNRHHIWVGMLRDWLMIASGNEGDYRPPNNVWIGVSVEDQKFADLRIPRLMQIPAKIRFLSVEPLLEPIRLYLNNDSGIHWIIVGGESGKDRRDCGADAICNVARQCSNAGLPIFVKQDCAFKPGQQGRIPDDIWNLKEFPNA